MSKKELETVEQTESGNIYTFPAGYLDREGNVHQEFEFNVIMTGRDEEAIGKPEIARNGSKVIRILLANRISRIGTLLKKDFKEDDWRDIIQDLLIGDQDYAMLLLRKFSYGEDFEVPLNCPNPDCELSKKGMKYMFKCGEIKIKPFGGSRELPFELPIGYQSKDGLLKTGVIRLAKGYDRELLDSVVRRNLGQANTSLLNRTIQKLGEKRPTEDMIRDFARKDREYLLDIITEGHFGPVMKQEVECPDCAKTFEASISLTNFV